MGFETQEANRNSNSQPTKRAFAYCTHKGNTISSYVIPTDSARTFVIVLQLLQRGQSHCQPINRHLLLRFSSRPKSYLFFLFGVWTNNKVLLRYLATSEVFSCDPARILGHITSGPLACKQPSSAVLRAQKSVHSILAYSLISHLHRSTRPWLLRTTER